MTEALYDVAILGAGASGLVAAIRAAERGRRVVVLEKSRKPGVKILISGGTRCNLTNARGLSNMRVVSGPIDPGYDPRQSRATRSIQQAFSPEGGAFLRPSLKAFSVEDTVKLFESEGVATKIEANGKIFPASDRALDVVNALVRRLERVGTELRLQCPALSVEQSEHGFDISVPDGLVFAQRVVVAVGGQSYPGCGTRGDGYAVARGFGHTIVDPRPALVPLRMADDWISSLSGLTLPDTIARILDPTGRVLLERREAVLFAHFGLTGPAILDVSRSVARSDQPESLTLSLDLVPDTRAEALDSQLQTVCRSGKAMVSNLLPESVPRRLAEHLLPGVGVPVDRRGPELSRQERQRVVGGLKGLSLRVTGTLGFAKAEVTSGGVALLEIDPTTLESRLQPGLHFIGEVLDLDGLIGGYNFQAAWSTGYLAGSVV